jgi:hypothetical protein
VLDGLAPRPHHVCSRFRRESQSDPDRPEPREPIARARRLQYPLSIDAPNNKMYACERCSDRICRRSVEGGEGTRHHHRSRLCLSSDRRWPGARLGLLAAAAAARAVSLLRFAARLRHGDCVRPDARHTLSVLFSLRLCGSVPPSSRGALRRN